MRRMNAVLLDWRPKRTAHVRVATAIIIRHVRAMITLFSSLATGHRLLEVVLEVRHQPNTCPAAFYYTVTRVSFDDIELGKYLKKEGRLLASQWFQNHKWPCNNKHFQTKLHSTNQKIKTPS